MTFSVSPMVPAMTTATPQARTYICGVIMRSLIFDDHRRSSQK